MIEQYLKSPSRSREELNHIKDELEVLFSRFGWKWAVLASTTGKIYQMEKKIPNDILNQLRMARTQIESGCYSACDIANALRKIEIELFSQLMKYGPQTTDEFLNLLGRAASGDISENEIDITAASPILPDCLSLPCVCLE